MNSGKARATMGAFLLVAGGINPALAQNASGQTVLEEILVTADRKSTFGSDYVQVGTFRNARQLDTPLTVSVINEDLLKAQLATTVLDALRNTSGVTTAAISSTVYNNLAIRGIPVENRGNWRLNGSLPIVNLIALPMENKTRLEALKGASALYYGFSTPSGMINLVTKRATDEPVTNLRAFGDQYGTAGLHVDVGRTTGNFGYRVNLLTSTLDNGVDNTEGDRSFASIALDWNPNDKFTAMLDVEYIDKTITEPTTLRPIDFRTSPVLPKLLDQSHNLGSEWFKSPATELNVLGRVLYRISDAWQVSVDAGISDMERDRRFSLFSFTDGVTGDGNLSVELANDNAYKNEFYRAELAGAFMTGGIEHELVVGASSNTRDAENPLLSFVSFEQNYFNPVIVPETPLPPSVIPNPSTIEDIGIYAFDRISLTDWLEVTLGIRNNDYKDESLTSEYSTDPTTYSASVMVKPTETFSIYASYIEGLENARVAPSTAINAGESLPAAVSEQIELGVKVEVLPGLLATLAYFEIDRESSYLNDQDFFVLDGLANYSGYEFSLSGEILPGLSVYSSGLWLDTKQESGASNVGNEIQNAPDFSGSLFLEYGPESLPNLSVSGGVFRVGDRAGNAGNTYFVPGYTTYDLGASYSMNLLQKDTTIALFWENVTDEKYWAAAGSSLLAPGLPSTLRMSVEMAF